MVMMVWGDIRMSLLLRGWDGHFKEKTLPNIYKFTHYKNIYSYIVEIKTKD